jgi:hypothetical protein
VDFERRRGTHSSSRRLPDALRRRSEPLIDRAVTTAERSSSSSPTIWASTISLSTDARRIARRTSTSWQPKACDSRHATASWIRHRACGRGDNQTDGALHRDDRLNRGTFASIIARPEATAKHKSSTPIGLALFQRTGYSTCHLNPRRERPGGSTASTNGSASKEVAWRRHRRLTRGTRRGIRRLP